MNTGTRCKHCGETYGMHGVGDECPTVYAHFEQEDEKLFTASDLKAAKLETLHAASDLIRADKETFERAGLMASSKGHYRALMLIDELWEEINASKG